MTMDNEWKDKLRERFSDYSVPEPEGLWEGIEQGIAGKPRRKMLPVWLLSGAAAAAAVALAVLLPSRKMTDQPVPDSTDRYVQAVESFPDGAGNDDSLSADTATPSSPAPTGNQELVHVVVASRRPLLAEAESSTPISVSDETVPDAVVPFERYSRLDRESEKEEMPDQVGHDDRVDHDDRVLSTTKKTEQTVEEILENTQTQEPSRKRFSVGAYGNGGQGASAQSAGYGMSNTAAYYSTRGIYNNGGGHSYTDGAPNGLSSGMVNMLSGNRASTYDAKHWAPVRTGVSLAWEFVPHLSLVSGLNWTVLQSTFTESAAGMRTECRQSLGYLGVPLRLEAGFEPIERLRLYIGAGGMVEKGLLSSSKVESFIGDHLEETGKSHPDTGGLLWSVGASAGAEYRFNDRVGVYVAPGIERHFDNGATVQSAYTEKPLHWNVDLGVRFHFGD